MVIQFITTAFNGMAQRLWIELDRLNHQVIVVYPKTDKQLIRETILIGPDLIIAPFLTYKLPEEIWKKYVCLIVHPGIIGDRGASSLDWAILRHQKQWGVTILQASEKIDAGDIWAYYQFDMRDVSKSELYRCEVTQAATKGILQAIDNFKDPCFTPLKLDYSNPRVTGSWNRKTKQSDYQFSWTEPAHSILRKINAADSSPGVITELFGKSFYCYGGHLEEKLTGKTGEIIAIRNKAICVASGRQSIWITHLKRNKENSIKLPATIALGRLAETVPELPLPPTTECRYQTWQEIRFRIKNQVGYVYFDFYNGAMDTDQCNRLRQAIVEAKKHCRTIVLMGGRDIWSNGIHLNVIENTTNPAQESWENILAIDDLIYEIITSTQHYIIAALQGNAGAGGVTMALAADKVLCRDGIVLNPHTINMGLYGSEYWTYLLPKRIGFEKAKRFTQDGLPWGVQISLEIGLIDGYYGQSASEFTNYVMQQAENIEHSHLIDKLIKSKGLQRKRDERYKPLSKYREEELVEMRKNFFENNMDYHYKRHCFVHKKPLNLLSVSKNLYRNRREIYRKRKWESIDYSED